MNWRKKYLWSLIMIYSFKDALAKGHLTSPQELTQDKCEWAEEAESGYWDITCRHTSTDDYLYDVFRLDINGRAFNGLSQLMIMNSNFTHIRYFFSPARMRKEKMLSDFTSLSLNFCGVNHIASGAFNDMKGLKHLDLGFNDIHEINFVSDLPKTINSLNLTNNKITNVNFELFCLHLNILDLSFNRISIFHVPKKPRSFPITKYLYLNDNYIKKIEIQPSKFNPHLSALSLNLANNNLTNVTVNCTDSYRIYEVHFDLMILSQALTDLNILSNPNYRISSTYMIVSGNPLVALDKKKFSKIYDSSYMDFSNCSLTNINPNTFQASNFQFLNFSLNNLTLLEDNSFALSYIGILDLSYNCIENIVNGFNDASIRHLKLSHNNIREINAKSLGNMRFLYDLDLSFNNISSNENSFANLGHSLSNLSLANNFLKKLDNQTFHNLSKLLILNLENNLLEIINCMVFQPLKSVREINLANNKLTTITSQLFSNLPLTIVTISKNYLETIEDKAFHRLNSIRNIHINENHGILTIEAAAFSELSGSNPLNIHLRQSKVAKITSDVFSKISNFKLLDLNQSSLASISLSSHDEYLNLNKLIVTFNGVLQQKSFLATPFLRQLVFCNSNIENIEERAFQGLFNLTIIEFQNSTIHNMSIGALRGLYSLQTLDGFKMFQNKIPLNGFTFQDLFSLSNLNLSFLMLQSLDPHTFHGLNHVQVLNLSYNELPYFLQSPFSKLSLLRILDLSYNKIHILQRDDFYGLASLEILNLNDNDISEIELGSFQNTPQLQSLLIANNNLTQIKIGTFSNLASLKELNIQNNRISELLFESFLPLVALESLNLESNNLKKISEVPLVFSLKFLKRVKIANNKWKCEFLAELIMTFRKHGIDYSTVDRNFYEDNIDGIHCIDVCKFLLCLQDSHGIN